MYILNKNDDYFKYLKKQRKQLLSFLKPLYVNADKKYFINKNRNKNHKINNQN